MKEALALVAKAWKAMLLLILFLSVQRFALAKLGSSAAWADQLQKTGAPLLWLKSQGLSLGIVGVLTLLFSSYATAGYMGALVQSHEGQGAGILDFFKAANRFVLRVFLGSILGFSPLVLWGLAFFGLGYFVLTYVRLAPTLPLRLCTGMGLLALIAAGPLLVWFVLRLALWLPAMVCAGGGVMGGLKRSYRLTRGHWWLVFAILILPYLLLLPLWRIPHAGGICISYVVPVFMPIAQLLLLKMFETVEPALTARVAEKVSKVPA